MVTADTATFATSSITTLSATYLTVGSIVFNPGASAYTLNSFVIYKSTMSGAGITNNSGILQTINLTAVPQFVGDEEWGVNLFTLSGSATAGTMIQYNVYGSSCADGKTDDAAQVTFASETTAGGATFVTYPGTIGAYGCHGQAGAVDFVESSSAENATFINNGVTVKGGNQAGVSFAANTTAANATITNHGGTVSQAYGGYASIYGEATAGDATLINDAGLVSGAFGGETDIFDTATAGNATLIANGGVGEGGKIIFAPFAFGTPSGGTARIEVFGNAELDISGCATGLTTGSLEGDGLVFLGAQNLTLGTNDLSTLFSGVIQNGGSNGGSGGSLTKTGTGKLTLTGANTYSGGTAINGGTLLVNNTIGSGLGSGPVQVTTGTLGGVGTIAGAVTIGTGHDAGAVLGPGKNTVTPGKLSIGGQLTLQTDGSYRVTVNSNASAADEIAAKRVRIRRAQIVLIDGGSTLLPPGTVFTVIDNTGRNPTSGTFANLPDGVIVTVNGNNFQASYEGGDGNDLTLTVVP